MKKETERTIHIKHDVINNLLNIRVYLEKSLKLSAKEASELLGNLTVSFLVHFGAKEAKDITDPKIQE